MEHEDMHRKKTGEPASLAEDATDWASRRADARRNHERIIAAALEVFAERGLDATMTEVAARAKVGKATIYRSYPTKDDLIAAAVRREFEWLEQRILVATQDPNAYAALSALLPDVFERLAGNRVLADMLQQSPAHTKRDTELFDQLLSAARAQGGIRGDATVTDIRVLVGGCARQLATLEDAPPELWRRYGELTLNALRPGENSAPFVSD